MKKPGRKLQKRTMGLLRNLMILGVSFVGLTVVLQLEIEYNLLVLIYALSAVAVLLYQLIRNRSDRDKLDQEVARSNFLMNAALPGGDVRLFELLPDGMIRVLSPGKGQGGQLKTTLETPRRLLSYLNCSAQWEAPFLAALEQAALGQDSEVEFQTMDQEETWIQLRMEPLPDNEETTAIGTIRDVTQKVKERHRREEASKLLTRMMDSTMAGLEIALEEDTWRRSGEPRPTRTCFSGPGRTLRTACLSETTSAPPSIPGTGSSTASPWNARPCCPPSWRAVPRPFRSTG